MLKAKNLFVCWQRPRSDLSGERVGQAKRATRSFLSFFFFDGSACKNLSVTESAAAGDRTLSEKK